MGLVSGLKQLIHEPVLLLFISVFFIFSCGMIPLYYFAYKPKRGSTEWIQRLEPVHFDRVCSVRFRPIDLVWTLLAALGGGILRGLYVLFQYRIPQRPHALEVLRVFLPDFLLMVGCAACFSLILYLLLQAMFRQTLPALLLGILGGLMLGSQFEALTLFAAALLFFYLWMSLSAQAQLLLRALFLLLAGGFYALSLLACSALLWFVPFFVGCYCVTLYFRFRQEAPEVRGRRLLSSLLMTLCLALLAFAAVIVVFGLRHSPAKEYFQSHGFRLFLMKDFYRIFFAAVEDCFVCLVRHERSLLRHILVEDSFLAILGLMATVPLLHGLFCRRDSRCLMIAALLVSCLPLLLIGYYCLVPALLLSVGWMWAMYSSRGKRLFVVLSAAVSGIFYLAVNILY